MSDLKTFLKNRLSELATKYKVNAELTILAILKGNFKAVETLYYELNDTDNRIHNILKQTSNQEEIKNIKHLQLDELPDYLHSITIVDAYKKLLSLKFTNFESENLEEKICVNKMSVNFKYDEDIPYIIIARTLYKNKKYPEALKLCEFIETISSSAPVWSLYGDIYREIGEYGKAIQSYLKYLELNKNDEEGLETLEELYEEALK